MKEILCFAAGFGLAAIIMIILNRKAIRAARKKRKQEVEKNPEKKIQATKIIVFSIMVTYYAAFIVAVWVVIARDIYQLSSLLTFTGGVSAFAVAFYCWKSKAENLEKIKKNNPEIMASLTDFSGMSSQ
ncbi:hypothetical protein [Dialister invisus]|uniref:hypothetical protein n=1 Tax=Dialister invisus TaxID=218538 RepID=UPI002674A3D5|nr:hypothetical protein [Dialister invisus]